MVPLRLNQTSPLADAPARAGIDPSLAPTLNHLRMVALQCRSAARTDLFQACATLSNDRRLASDTAAELLMRCLAQALGRTPVLFRPGVEEMSFDEAWLMRLIASHAASDDDSFSFLLRRRVPKHAQRNLGFLIASVSERFYQV